MGCGPIRARPIGPDSIRAANSIARPSKISGQFGPAHRARPIFPALVGEMTITLQNVDIILSLHIDGPSVTGTCVFDVAGLCWELIGVTPPTDALRGSAISSGGYVTSYPPPAPDAYEVALERSARGFILALMRSFLFVDKNMFIYAFSHYYEI